MTNLIESDNRHALYKVVLIASDWKNRVNFENI